MPLEGTDDWNVIIERMFCEKDGLQVLCKVCHDIKSNEEKKIRKDLKERAEKATYRCWIDMKARCYNPKSQRFYTHGGRGITVCDRWKDSYENFVLDMGIKPEGYTLDRIDNDKGYEPGNCRWATPKEQANNRRTNIFVEFDGQILTVKQWSEALGISFSALMKRLSRMPVEKALSKERFWEEVENKDQILKEYLEGGISQKKLAEKYGISQACISKWYKNYRCEAEGEE